MWIYLSTVDIFILNLHGTRCTCIYIKAYESATKKIRPANQKLKKKLNRLELPLLEGRVAANKQVQIFPSSGECKLNP